MKKLPFYLFALITLLNSSSFAQKSAGDGSLNLPVEITGAIRTASFDRPRVVAVGNNTESTTSVVALERRTFDLINDEREKRGLRRLEWSEDAARIARLHSRNMAANNFFNHRGLDGLMVDDRAEQAGIFDWRAIGENIAYNRGFDHPLEVAVEKWLESPAHRDNMLNKDWREAGIGMAISSNGAYYFTQVFILRKK